MNDGFLNRKGLGRLIQIAGFGAMLLSACGMGASEESANAGTRPLVVTAPETPTFRIAPLGSPRLLLSDAATMARLRAGLKRGDTAARRFKSVVDAQLQGTNSYAFQPWFAALLGQISESPHYCHFAVDASERFVLGEEALIRAHRRPSVANDSYLEVGPVVGNLALVYDWCRAQMTPQQRTRWRSYANQAVWNIWNHKQAHWGNRHHPWTGWSVDNPSNNYYYSFLRATMMLGLASHGENDLAPVWISRFRNEKVARQLVPVFQRDLTGGGSLEGTGYGTAMKGLFDLYYWWSKSTGEDIAGLTPHPLASLDKFLHDITPTLDRLAPTGDHARDSTASLFDYHREYLMILARLHPEDAMAGVAKTLLAHSSTPQMANAFQAWIDFVYGLDDIAAQPLTRLPLARWSSGTGQFSMRSAWRTDAAYSNLICGPYTESHAHRDQGSFVFFKGDWLAYDANIDSRSGLLQAEAAHNLVRFERNGSPVQQTPGRQCRMTALADRVHYSYARADATPLYTGRRPQDVSRAERELVFIRPATLVVIDRVQTSGSPTSRIWTVNLPALPSVTGAHLHMVTAQGHRLDVTRLVPAGLPWSVTPWPQLSTDLKGGYRAEATDSSGDTSLFLHVLGADGAFQQARVFDASGRTGVSISLVDGRVVALRFDNSTPGGRIDIRDAAGSMLLEEALPDTVELLPRFKD